MREQWEWDLTNAIGKARDAGLTDVVIAIQTAICHIGIMKGKVEDLRTLKEILRK